MPSPQHKLSDLLTDFPDAVAIAVIAENGDVEAVPRPPTPAAVAAVGGLLHVADRVAAEMSEEGPVQQVLVDTPDGAVAVVREGGRCLAAVTRPRPRSIGLLLYELRTLHDHGEAMP